MKDKKWKEFQRQSEKCYLSMTGVKEDKECWNKAFEILKEIITNGRNEQPGYGAELYLLDEDTDYCYDVQGWLEDYLDELDMREAHEKLLEVCDELIGMFQWKEDSPSSIKFTKASTLSAMGRKDDAVEFCRQWLADESDNIAAVTANIYTDIEIEDWEAAEQLIKQHIHEETQCTEENDILFIAASTYYQKTGNEKEKERIDQALEAYEEYLEEYFMGDEEDDDVMWEEGLPFN